MFEYNYYNYKKSVHAKLDPFNEYQLNESEQDQNLLGIYSDALRKLSKGCFR
jgi:hypothetical protein